MQSEPRIRCAEMKDILLVYVPSGPFLVSDLDDVASELKRTAAKKLVSWTDGSVTADSMVRSRIAATFKGIKVAQVTDSMVVRGVITALSWMGMDVRAFPSTRIADAARFLGANDIDAGEISDVFTSLQTQGRHKPAV